jgi:hypothetical protein
MGGRSVAFLCWRNGRLLILFHNFFFVFQNCTYGIWKNVENVDVALYKWFKEKRNQNIPISGPILMAKSEDFATKLRDRDFTPTIE